MEKTIGSHETEIKDYQALIEKLGYASSSEEIPDNVVCLNIEKQKR